MGVSLSHFSKPRNWISFFAILLLFSSCSVNSGYSKRKARTSKHHASYVKYSPKSEWRPTKRHTIPVVVNANVKRWINTFNGPLRKNFTRWIRRLGHYGPIIEEILKEEGAPPDLIYLAMIESGFNLNAISHASAAGPWQFISSTGRMYGLNNGFFIDERQDLVQSTKAAARHLKDLYKIYNDWYLAFAAYNAGPGKVNRAIKRGRTKNYWAISSRKSRLLRQETKDYVPKILAALTIVKNYRKYGYDDKSFGDPLEFEQVYVPDATDIHIIAKSANTSTHMIRTLNPSLVVGITPPGKRFAIYIPKGAKDEFQKNYAKVPASKRVTNLQYKSGYRETIATIAQKYNVSAASLARMNGKKVRQKLRTGTVINIPAKKSTLLAMAKTGPYYTGSSSSKVYYYKVRKGDTLSRIAHKNKTSTKNLAKWNGLKRNSQLKVGQRLKIYNKSKGRSSSGQFLAYKSSGSQKRISGVAHIIQQDNTPIAYSPEPTKKSAKTKVKVPTMVATNDAYPESDYDDQPAIVKSIDNDDLGQESLKTAFADEPIKPKLNKPTKRYHTVRKGDSLSSIATKYDMRISDLKSLNKLKSNKIRIKQRLLIQSTSSAPTTIAKTPVKKQNSYYIVKSNDTLSGIAVKNRVKISQIKDWNNLNSNKIKVGQKLKIVGETKTNSIATNSIQQNKIIFHYVKSGETLWSLSRKYNVKVDDIKRWNKLKSNKVKLKQKIKIIAALPSKSQNS